MRILLALGLSSILAACSGENIETPVPEAFDVLLHGGELFNGDNASPIKGDVGIRNDRIVALGGDLSAHPSTLTLDVTGLAVTPGFIDIHSHAIRNSLDDDMFRWPDAENLIRQGVTTVIGGPDGDSPLPITDTFDAIEANPSAVNFGTFVGHGSIRGLIVGEQDRPATEEEMQLMREQVALAMDAGSFGLSSGLIYAPRRFGDAEEVIELAKVAAPYGGIYISHMREEGLEVLNSVAETIRIGEEGGHRTQY